jgi:hypothetical protein
MPSVPPVACTHDLGPGITVCLRCRQEERQAAYKRQQRLLTRAGVMALGFVAISVVGASIVNAIRAAVRVQQAKPVAVATFRSDVKPQGEPRLVVAPTATPAGAAATPATTLVVTPDVTPGVTPVMPPATPAAPAPVVTRVTPPLTFVVPEGRTEFDDGVVTERMGDSAIVSFDTPLIRTRRRDKFERIVRETLPVLYGKRADSLLATFPDGEITVGGDLLTELPVRGIQLPMANGWVLEVWPETRPGQDGPLVVRYRTKVVKG